LRERAVLQHICHRIACSPHQLLQSTSRHIGTVKACPKSGDAGAWRESERSIEGTNDVGDRDLGRIARQAMSPMGPAPAFDDPVISKLDQNRLEELTWNSFAFSDT